MIKMTCGFCGEEMKMEHGAIHECETDVDETIKKNQDSAIHATGYWKGIEYKRQCELTDEEILELSNTMPYANRFEFARAILKKAQEK